MDLTLLLVGNTEDNGSIIGNIIIGRKAFEPRALTCELQTGVLEDGRTISVINTPGFCRDSLDTELLEEVKKCISFARNGMDAVLYVVDPEGRVDVHEQVAEIQYLKSLFGKDIISYMIPVFRSSRFILLPRTTSENLCRYVVRISQGRLVDFYKCTLRGDEAHRSKTIRDLLSEVKKVTTHNGGKPFMTQEQLFSRLEQMVEAYETAMNGNKEHTTWRIDVVEASLRDKTTRIEQQMAEEANVSRLKADERTKDAQNHLDKRIQKHMEEFQTALKDQQKNSDEQMQKQKEEFQTALKDQQKNSDEQMRRLREQFHLALEDQQKKSDEQIQKQNEGFQRALEAQQKKSDEQIEKLKEGLERVEKDWLNTSEITMELESSTFHVYDPSTYLLQSGIR